MSDVLVGSDPGLEDLVRKIVARADPVEIWLFGSRARGDHHQDSDYDLLIVVDDSWPVERTSLKEAFKLIEGRKTPADAMLVRKSTFEEHKSQIGSLSRIVWLEGKVIYVRKMAKSLA